MSADPQATPGSFRWDDETRAVLSAAVELADAAPREQGGTYMNLVPASKVEALRRALEATGIDWRLS